MEHDTDQPVNVYDRVTTAIIRALEQGVVPWAKSWSGPAPFKVPTNPISKHDYQGINCLLLWLTQVYEGYVTPAYMTFKQMQSKGGSLKPKDPEKGYQKGDQQGHLVIRWDRFLPRQYKDQGFGWVLDTKTGQRLERDKAERGFLRVFTVFNLDQIDGLPPELAQAAAQPIDPFAMEPELHRMVEAWGCPIVHGGDKACYYPDFHRVHMPPAASFTSKEEYQATLLHELVHSTKRATGRDQEKPYEGEGAKMLNYAFEELVAEIGAAFLCAHFGLEGQANHPGYIAHYLALLKHDNQAIVRAAAKARAAADLLLATIQPEPAPDL
jgi:antirestriction protein ArdC